MKQGHAVHRIRSNWQIRKQADKRIEKLKNYIQTIILGKTGKFKAFLKPKKKYFVLKNLGKALFLSIERFHTGRFRFVSIFHSAKQALTSAKGFAWEKLENKSNDIGNENDH